MPTFPPYPDALPRCLNPLNPRHYLLLAYWLYFRPTHLKAYLYQADPVLYRAGPGSSIFRTREVPAYRNLYLVALGTTLLISGVLGVPIVWGASALQGTPPEWGGMAVGVAFGVAFGVAGGVAEGVAVGVAVGVAFGVAFGVAGGVALGVAGGVAVGVAFGVALGVAVGVAFGVAGGVAEGVAFGVAVGVAFGVAFGVAGGVAYGVALGVAGGVAFGVASGVGGLRLPFYLLQGGGLLPLPGKFRHPLWWDELAVLPFLGVQRAIGTVWQRGHELGLQQLAPLAANPFQRWALQRVLHMPLQDSATALPFLYRLFEQESLDVYAIAPVSQFDWQDIPSVHQVCVSELAGCGDYHARRLEDSVWRLTQPLRIRPAAPLTALAYLLYHLEWEDGADALFQLFNQDRYRSNYDRLLDYPGGQEIQQSFGCMATYLGYTSLAGIAQAQPCLTGLPAADSAIRPAVIQALQAFGRISQDIAVFQAATSRLNQLAALGRATDALEEIGTYIETTVKSPERKLLQAIQQHWRKLVSEASGELGTIVIAEPVANPYVAGNPVAGELFVGREEILRELEELWLKPGQVDSVVLYGHRRMGKSSILKNLPNRLDPQRNWVVAFNLQRVGKVSSTGELLYALALELYDRCIAEGLVVSEPAEAAFLDPNRNPWQACDRWLKPLAPHMQNRRFIVAMDEFELIETAMDDRRVEKYLTEFLRGIIQTTDWFVLALAGLYTLQEKTHDYWHPLFGSIKPRKVSFLSPESTRRLITQPSPDFPLDYTPDALEEIIRLTHGQPYLVQLIGQNLVARFNQQVFEAGQDPHQAIAFADVQAVIQSPAFFQDGGAYFTGVWRQAEDSDPHGQTQILDALCNGKKSMAALADATKLSGKETAAAIKTLESHDVIGCSDAGEYAFTVELMRLWVQQRRGGGS